MVERIFGCPAADLFVMEHGAGGLSARIADVCKRDCGARTASGRNTRVFVGEIEAARKGVRTHAKKDFERTAHIGFGPHRLWERAAAFARVDSSASPRPPAQVCFGAAE